MFNIYSILFGLSFNYSLPFIGTLYFSQILIILSAIFFFIKKKIIFDNKIKTLLLLSFLWILSASLSDLLNQNSLNNFARGFSKIIITSLSFYVFYCINKNIKYGLIKIIAWIAVFKILFGLIYINSPENIHFYWKMGLGTSLIILINLYFISNKKIKSLAIIMMSIAFLSLYFQTRYLFLFCFCSSVLTLLIKNKTISTYNLFKLFFVVFFLTSVSIFLYQILLKFNFLPTQLIVKSTLQDGKYTYLLGGRSEIISALKAIKDAPLLGHGSWAQNCYYNTYLENFLYQNNYAYNYVDLDNDCLIKGHSVIFETWLNHGILGFIFWIYIFYNLIKNVKNNITSENKLFPLLIFITFLITWDLFLSPYGGTRIVELPLYVSILIFTHNKDIAK